MLLLKHQLKLFYGTRRQFQIISFYDPEDTINEVAIYPNLTLLHALIQSSISEDKFPFPEFACCTIATKAEA